MKIAQVHSHMGGLEYIQVHQPAAWTELKSAIAAVNSQPSSATHIKAEIGKVLNNRGWKPGRFGDSDLAKSRVGVEFQFGRRHLNIYDLLARHIAHYIGKVIDVGVEILPMKSLQQQMSSGIGYYEGELYNLIREGRGVPAVALVIIGICPD